MTEEKRKNKRKGAEHLFKGVIGVNIATGQAITFACIKDTATVGFEPSCVCDCCKGKRNTHKGYAWKYYKEK